MTKRKRGKKLSTINTTNTVRNLRTTTYTRSEVTMILPKNHHETKDPTTRTGKTQGKQDEGKKGTKKNQELKNGSENNKEQRNELKQKDSVNNEVEVETWENAMESEIETTESTGNNATTNDDFGANDMELNEACKAMDWNQYDNTTGKKNTKGHANEGKAAGWTKVTGKRENATIYNTESKDTRVDETATEIMKRRGEMAVEAATNRDTPI